MSDLSQAIQEDILAGQYSFAEIASRNEVPLDWVREVCREMLENDSLQSPEPTVEDCLQFDMGKYLYLRENGLA